MCEVLNKTRKKTAVGYKVVVKVDGKYYSPCTGLEYQKNMKIPVLKVRLPNYVSYYNNVLSSKITFNKKMKGKTGIINTLSDAKSLQGGLQDWIEGNDDGREIVILRMTIGGDIYKGTTPTRMFEVADTLIGTKIVDFEEI